MENKVKAWIARDKDGDLFVYSDIPIRCKNHWGYPACFNLDKSMFPSIKWEDDEPTEAYITLAEPQEQPKQEQEIDWEQRMAEIAESIFVTEQPYINCEEDVEKYAEIAIQRAKILINKLKNQSDNV